MDTLIKSTLHSEVSDGRVKYVRKPNVWCGDPENGYLPGDLVDANGLADFIALNDIVHDDPAIQELREAAEEMNTAIENRLSTYYTKDEVDDKFMTDDGSNGHAYVDLGLPSGTKWATMNVGASSETDYGNYYQYGKGAAQYAATSGDSNYSGTEDPLAASADTAVQVWGGSWHMPTRAQMQELTANTTYQWTTINGVNGGKFTATNGNYVFFPAAGRWNSGRQYVVGDFGGCWGSSPSGSGSAYRLGFDDGGNGVDDFGSRKGGYSVRGVLDSTEKTEKYATKAEVEAKQDTLVSGTSIKTLNGESILGSGNIDIAAGDASTLIETTYAELVAAKNGGTLAKGAWYRITDYVTTTTQSNTQSAGHAFDVIVRADSESVLNENAFAIQHEGDTYFANQKLSAWELKYDINNDTNKYAWADATNGKGVIYYMKDENDNECPYDFKNIQFEVGAKQQAGTVANVFYFTFSVATGENDATVTDHSMNGAYCYCNKMVLYISSNKRKLNANVFRNTSATSGCFYNTFGADCQSNTFGNTCSGNTFRNTCSGNTFGGGCTQNTFGGSCINNIFGSNCQSNKFGNTCLSNTFGSGCNQNTLEKGCTNNIFGSKCTQNTFGEGCTQNTFGEGCTNNIFGSNCQSNKFGTVSAVKNFYKNIIFENGVQHVLLDCTESTNPGKYCQNVLVGMGIAGKILTVATAGNAFKTVFKTANDVEIDA